MRALVAVLTLAAAVFGVTGLFPLLVERRLDALAPGGVEIGALHYNPFTGRLALGRVRARDAAGREVFRADSVLASAAPLSALGGALALGRVRVAEPRLTLRVEADLGLEEVAAGLGVAQAFLAPGGAPALPLRVDDLVISGGVVSVEGAGERGTPLVVRDLDLRLGRLTTAALGGGDVAFAVEMAVYGTVVHVTGQPRGAAYALRVRARGVDAAALARDFPVTALEPIERGRADLDAELVLADGRVLASGSMRLADAVLTLPLPGGPRLRAGALTVVADAVDLAAGTGRLARVDLAAPALTLPAPAAAAALRALTAPPRDEGELLVRRVSITDGTLSIDGPQDLRFGGLQLAAQLSERRSDNPGWFVNARAGLGPAEVSVEGLLARDVRALDAVARVQRLPLAHWRALGGAAPIGWDARVSFDGRVRVVVAESQTLATATGQAELQEVRAPTAGGFRAERVALAIRHLQWPAADAVFDRVVVTRPAFGLGALAQWAGALVTGGMSIVEGEMTAGAPGRALHRLALELARDDRAGLARLRLTASTDAGAPVDLDRVMPYAPAEPGLPLGFLAATLEEAARFAAGEGAPSTLPRDAVAP